MKKLYEEIIWRNYMENMKEYSKATNSRRNPKMITAKKITIKKALIVTIRKGCYVKKSMSPLFSF